VLTRLPAPHRAPAEAVARYLDDVFADRVYALPDSEYRHFVARLARQNITGGATYDALIAAVARFRDAELLTCDERAARTYERCGTEVKLLA
jgi:predicted nucleic acid-binding protein